MKLSFEKKLAREEITNELAEYNNLKEELSAIILSLEKATGEEKEGLLKRKNKIEEKLKELESKSKTGEIDRAAKKKFEQGPEFGPRD